MPCWLDPFGQYWIKLKDHWELQHVLLITINVASRREPLREVLPLREERAKMQITYYPKDFTTLNPEFLKFLKL